MHYFLLDLINWFPYRCSPTLCKQTNNRTSNQPTRTVGAIPSSTALTATIGSLSCTILTCGSTHCKHEQQKIPIDIISTHQRLHYLYRISLIIIVCILVYRILEYMHVQIHYICLHPHDCERHLNICSFCCARQ